MRQSHRIIRNSFYNLVPQIWMLGLAVFTTPYVLHQLGVDAYGILALVSIVVGYLAFLDLGLNTAIIRFIAMHNAKGESADIVHVTQTSLVAFLCLGCCAGGALCLLSRPLAKLLEVPHPQALSRLFVLAPLADLAPGLVPPGWGRSVEAARRQQVRLEGPSAVRPVARWDGSAQGWRPIQPG